MPRRALVLIISCLTALALVYLSNKISHSFRTREVTTHKKVIGLISAEPKAVQIRSSQSDFTANTTKSVEVHDGDEIIVALGTSATLTLFDYQLILRDRAQIKVELWNSTAANSPVYITPLHGEIAMAQKGNPGTVYVVYDRRMIPPEAIPTKIGPRSTLNEPSPAALTHDTSDTDTSIDPKPISPETQTAAPEPKLETPAAKPKEPPQNTLTNEEIAITLGNNASQLRRCQMNSLRDGEMANGSILFSITIDKDGKVKALSVLKDETQNESLMNCTTTVIQRVQFRTFQGDPITISYPIEFR